MMIFIERFFVRTFHAIVPMLFSITIADFDHRLT
jgi:hypothetical protein